MLAVTLVRYQLRIATKSLLFQAEATSLAVAPFSIPFHPCGEPLSPLKLAPVDTPVNETEHSLTFLEVEVLILNHYSMLYRPQHKLNWLD